MGSKSSKQEPKPEPKQEPKQTENNHILPIVPTKPPVANISCGHRPVPQQPTISAIPKSPWKPYSEEVNNVTTLFHQWELSPKEPKRYSQAPEKSEKNPQLFDINTPETVTYEELHRHDGEYQRVARMITNKRNFIVHSIHKITNPYLEEAYELKREQKESEFPYVEEKLLFHGTKQSCVDDICEMNFDWRLCKSHKYGRGISFSPNSTYASNYSDRNVHEKVMLVAKVLVGMSCQGDEDTILPPDGYDTTQKDEGIVIVKFEDCEFYPVYKIDYHLVDENVGKRGHGRGRRGTGRGVPQRNYVDNYDFELDYDFY